MQAFHSHNGTFRPAIFDAFERSHPVLAAYFYQLRGGIGVSTLNQHADDSCSVKYVFFFFFQRIWRGPGWHYWTFGCRIQKRLILIILLKIRNVNDCWLGGVTCWRWQKQSLGLPQQAKFSLFQSQDCPCHLASQFCLPSNLCSGAIVA